MPLLSRLSGRLDPWLSATLLVALVARMAWLTYVDIVPASDARAYYDLATSIAEGNGFGYREPTAFLPVGYPATLGLFFGVLGSDVWVGELVNMIASLVTVACTYWTAQLLYGRRTALVAGLFMAFLPSQVITNTLLFSEPVFTAVEMAAVLLIVLALQHAPRQFSLPSLAPSSAGAIIAIALFPHFDALRIAAVFSLVVGALVAFYLWRSGQRSQLLWLTAGLLTGYAMLVRPVASLVVVAVLVALWLTGGRQALGWPLKALGRAQVAPSMAIFVVAVALPVLPWIARNWEEVGVGSNIATNGGYNLLVANHDTANGCWTLIDPKFPEIMAIDNEAERDRRLQREALSFMAENPDQVLLLVPQRFDCTWAADDINVDFNTIEQPDSPGATQQALIRIGSNWYYYGLLWLGLLGLPFWWRRTAAHLIPALIVGLTAGWYLVFFGGDRFHQPLLPLVAIWAACGLLGIPRWLQLARQTARRSSSDGG